MITNKYLCEFKQVQYPIKLCFDVLLMMSTNKAQGQTLKSAGLDITNLYFTQGQFYVACSHVKKYGGKNPMYACTLTNKYYNLCTKYIQRYYIN